MRSSPKIGHAAGCDWIPEDRKLRLEFVLGEEMGKFNGMLIEPTKRGLYCEAGGFYIDPWRAVDRAVITHAHSDHARSGSAAYLCSESGEGVLRERVGKQASIETAAWGEPRTIGKVQVSLHPAGHVLGSAQILVEHQGERWVISGDYKTQVDRSCEMFEPVSCNTFITESTFGLPIYRWQPTQEVLDQVHAWWRTNQEAGRTSILFAYALGKAQRILCGLDPGIGPIGVHGTVDRFLPHYRHWGKPIPDCLHAKGEAIKDLKGKGIVIAPGSTQNTDWIRKFAPYSLAFASGWMQVRGGRRRRALDQGFVISDHADWDGLLGAIEATGAERIGVTHGYTDPLVRWLKEQGKEAWEVPTRFQGEGVEDSESEEAEPPTFEKETP